MSDLKTLPPPDADSLLLFISVECFAERLIGGEPVALPRGEWQGVICGLPEDWEALLEARSQAELPALARWKESDLIKMAQAPDPLAELSPSLPVFVAAKELGVIYWPLEIIAPALGYGEAEEGALEAMRKRMAAMVGLIAQAGGCEAPMDLGRFSGSARSGWQAVSERSLAPWRALSEERSLGESLSSAKGHGPRPGL